MSACQVPTAQKYFDAARPVHKVQSATYNMLHIDSRKTA